MYTIDKHNSMNTIWNTDIIYMYSHIGQRCGVHTAIENEGGRGKPVCYRVNPERSENIENINYTVFGLQKANITS